ncbi:hypothetical protein [Methylobacterium nigriterrae]|uniref:hypothetical protein n=1 Tax=Methylobacterium nigriterrae TaxID=3127512 RepID=UPI00301322BF
MPATRRLAPCAPPEHDPERCLVQAYARLILLPARANGSKATVIASAGTRDVRLVEELSEDGAPEQARLSVEIHDRQSGSTIASVPCEDLQEAESATVALLANVGSLGQRMDGPPPRRGDAILTFRPIPVATGCADEAGLLALADGKLAAILVQLSEELHGPGAAGCWFVEVGFGPCRPDGERVFASLGAAEHWLRGRLAAKEGSHAQG